MTKRVLFAGSFCRPERFRVQGLYLLILLGLTGVSAHATTYYRWVDDAGIPHYTSTPPQGVKAEKVTSTNYEPPAAPPVASKEANDDQQKSPAVAVDSKNPERCAMARERLRVLQNGRRLRMETEDGGFRYLTEDDIKQEMAVSQKAIDESC